jgi:hypothetical protein
MRARRLSKLALLTIWTGLPTWAGPTTEPASLATHIEEPGRPPLPTGPEVAAARQAILTEMNGDLALDGPAMHARACERFMALAGASGGDLNRRFAALAECQRFAEGHGLAVQAAGAIAEMARWWGFAKFDRLKKSLEAVAGATTTREQRESLANVARGLADEAAAAETWDAAAGLIKVGQQAAEKSGNRGLTADVAADANNIDTARRQSAEMAVYTKQLDADPNDVRANQAMGEYLCVVRRQVGKGMVCLSRGVPGPIRDAAAAELENSMYMGKGAHIGLAEMWGKAAKVPTDSKPMREFCLGLAAGHDMESLPEMTAAERGPAEKRLTAWMNSHVAAGQNFGISEPDDAWKGLGRVRFVLRDDGDDLATYQGQLLVERLPIKAELPGARYTLWVLAVDPTGKGTVFKAAGKVIWPKELEKPARMSGPKRKTVKDLTPPKSKVTAAFVKIEIEGKPVFQALSSMPMERPWWLMPDLLAPER